MKVGIPKERRPGEARVAASPDTVKRYRGQGLDVVVERGAGRGAAIGDDAFEKAGATLGSAEEALGADIVLKVQRPEDDEAERLTAQGKCRAVLPFCGRGKHAVFHPASSGKIGQRRQPQCLKFVRCNGIE